MTEEQKNQLDQQIRKHIDGRSDNPTTASPYDQLADALLSCINDAIFGAIHSPDFAHQLAELGYVVAPIADDIPEPPEEWLHDAVDLLGLTGSPTDLLEAVHSLWERAYQAGHEGANAR